jgi:hypothetical protein
MTEVAAVMQRYLALSRGDRTARAQADEHWWAIDAALDEGCGRRRNRGMVTTTRLLSHATDRQSLSPMGTTIASGVRGR